MGLQFQRAHLVVGDLLPGLILGGVQQGFDLEATLGRRAANEIDHRFETEERAPAPVHTDERKQPMLHLVPLARSRRIVADGHRDAQPIREPLQVHFPRPEAGAVAAASVGADQQSPRLRVRVAPQQRRLLSTAHSAVSWVIPTLTTASSRATSYVPYGIALPTPAAGKSCTK